MSAPATSPSSGSAPPSCASPMQACAKATPTTSTSRARAQIIRELRSPYPFERFGDTGLAGEDDAAAFEGWDRALPAADLTEGFGVARFRAGFAVAAARFVA